MNMENFNTEKFTTPDVVKLTDTSNHGIMSIMLSRAAVGFLLKGRKFIYCGDKCTEVNEGDIFIYDAGLHYEENAVSQSGTYEQITFYVSPSSLQQILLGLNSSYGLNYTNRHSCEKCRTQNFVAMRANDTLRDFFASVNQSFRQSGFQHNDVSQRIKLNELVYLILADTDNCLKSKILANADAVNGQFAMVIYNNVFKDISLESLAQMTNRSLTSFKKEFKRQFSTPPHKWFIAQRLDRSKVLLLSTNKTISEVGMECAFSNISHFIKLFKHRFHDTPAVFRQKRVLVQQTENREPEKVEEKELVAVEK